jgi:type 1 glutamine amidotransferase
VRVIVRDPKHPATRGLEPAFHVFDEIYQFKRYDPARVHLILGLDAHPETGAPGKYPLAWTREQGKGRVFYTGLGHRPDVIAAPWYRAHVRGGIEWALGRGTGR